MKEMSFWMHIRDLKLVFFRVLLVFIALTVLFYCYHSSILKILLHHLDGKPIGNIIFTNIVDGFLFRLDVSTSMAIFAILPYVMTEVYFFLKSALINREVVMLPVILLSCITLFFVGCCCAYFYILPNAVDFFITFFTNDITLQLKAVEYVDFVLALMIAFGVFMQAPIVIVLLDRFGIVDHSFFVKKRKFMIVGIFTISAILTPPDIASQVILGSLILIFIEISLVFCRMFGRGKRVVV